MSHACPTDNTWPIYKSSEEKKYAYFESFIPMLTQECSKFLEKNLKDWNVFVSGQSREKKLQETGCMESLLK